MAITEKDVQHVAKLARLELSEDETRVMLRDLGNILEYVQTLSEVDTEGVEPTTWIAVERMPMRRDAVAPGVATEAALAQAPRASEDAFAVPAFMDET